jgi:lipoprotein-anchoring transpeptidase ErfK/SrfK
MSPGPGRLVAPGPLRPRYGRIALLLSAVGVTLVAVLGATGVLPGTSTAPLEAGRQGAVSLAAEDTDSPAEEVVSPVMMGRPERAAPTEADPEALPARSGRGKRVVFDMSDQRVWLVGGDGRVRRTYLVSGSLTDNLAPGTYEVYSTSRHAVGIDDSGTMQYMVRFAHGKRAAIGFHDIPVDDGKLVQTRAELGTPQSHGCIRQWRPDARALWYFAIVGTKVVVTA